MAQKEEKATARVSPWNTRTLHGVELTRVEDKNGQPQWECTIEGEPWLLYRRKQKDWAAYTKDHLTGAASVSLGRLIQWIVGNRSTWREKLAVRRKAGTRMVDPKSMPFGVGK
jgi:hypothetical protein